MPFRLTLLLVLGVASTLVATAPTAADPGGGRPITPRLRDGRDSHGIIRGPSDALGAVPLSSPAYDPWLQTRNQLRDQIAALNGQRGDTSTQIAAIESDKAAQVARAGTATARLADLDGLIAAVDQDLRRIAVSAFTGGRDGSYEGNTGSGGALVPSIDALLRRRLSTEATDVLVARRADDVAQRATAQADLDDARSHADAADAAAQAQRTDLTRTSAAIESLSGDLDRAESQLASARSGTVVTGTDLPLTALDAYWRATTEVARGAPPMTQCGLQWWVLAGIGEMESHHGNGAGGLADDGTITQRIIGPALDGVAYQLIPDSDRGLLDGDPLVDHAIGPMQFLPGTWRTAGADLSGDDVADPFNLYDAALAAARYLCRGGPLVDDVSVRAAVRRYNNSQAYVDAVMTWADTYRLAAVGTPP